MRRVEIDLFSFTLASRREYLCSRLARLSTNLQSRKTWNFSSRKDENRLCWNHAVYRLYQNLIFISRKRYFQLSTPLFSLYSCSSEIMVSKTVDKLNSTSPVRKQLATIELKVSNLSRKRELAKPVLKQRVLSISLTFSSSRPSISQTYPIFISKRLVGSAARSSNTRRRRRGRRKRRKRARKVANGHYTATIASLSTVCNVTCLRGLARHLRSYRAIILSCIPALCQLSFLTFRYSFPIPKRPAVSSTLFPHFPTPRWNILT